jgi:hypothetical protein
MKKILIIFICFCLLFPINIVPFPGNIVLADENQPLISQENYSGFDINVTYQDCIAQGWRATNYQLDVTKISIYVTTTATEGVVRAGISTIRTYDDNLWLVNDTKQLSELNGWVDFPNVDCSVTGGQTYWLLFEVLTPGKNATVHGGLNDSYPDGDLWFNKNHNISWDQQGDYVMAFRIYGNEIVSPKVQTLNATHVENNSAWLCGKILDDGGKDCKIRFQIKKTGGEPWNPSDWNGSYNTNDKFYEVVTGLDPGTEYLFRAGANNSINTTWDNNWTSFTTDVNDCIPEYHAVLFFPYYDHPGQPEWKEQYDMLKSILEYYGWTNIYTLLGAEATEDNLLSTLQNLSDDPWDTTLIVIATHGSPGEFVTSNTLMTYKNLSDKGVDYLKSAGIAIIIEACASGSALWDNQSLKKDGRVIITAGNDQENHGDPYLLKDICAYLDEFADYSEFGDKNGAVSIEEIHKCINYTHFIGRYEDDYPTKEDNSSELYITFQNWSTGCVDQLNPACLSTAASEYVHEYYNESEQVNETYKAAQSFKPNYSQYDTLTKIRVELNYTWNYEPNVNLVVSIRKGQLNSSDIVPPVLVSPDQIKNTNPEEKNYVMIDFNDISNISQDDYFIVFSPEGVDDQNAKYLVKTTPYNSYENGSLYRWIYENETWEENPPSPQDRDVKFITYGLNSSNMPPYLPKRPSGPEGGYALVSYDFNVTTTDMNGNNVYYDVDWGDGKSNYTSWEPSGSLIQVNHTWESSGNYSIKVKAIDKNLQESGWSDVYVVNILPNEPPDAPVIDGPTNGKPKEEYNYTFSSTDPDNDNIRYYIEWGDGDTNETAFNTSGEEVTVGHTWAEQGTYTIKACAQDIHGCNSSWSTLEATIPRDIFGYTISGAFSQNIKNMITGSIFTVLANCTADNISVYVQTNPGMSPGTECMIYGVSGSVLIGTTEEKILNTGGEGAWVTFNFSEKPNLVRDTEYVLVCWSNDTCNFFYDNATSELSRYRNETCSADLPLSPINWTSNESKIYSIFCRYTTKPDITNISANPNTVGFGFNVTISAYINDNGCDIDNVIVNITYPNNNTENFTMNNTGNSTYSYVFSDTWVVGQYNYSIWAVDESGGTNNSSVYNFNVSANATISVCTIKDSYGGNETVNLTDPPVDPSLIGYELLDDGKVLRIWNNYDSYYFNTTSGIQLTNHYNKYWSHNVLMLGYYNNNQWNLIYRTDELSGFNKNIESDNETYVNATLWKDLTYQGYDFRLAIRYYLGVDDKELTIIPYIKNLGQAILYNLGFAWELKDIQVDMTTSGDYIEINGTTFYLNQSLDETYKNMDQSCFYIRENISSDRSESLYLGWNDSLDYLVKVKSQEGQYNAPVTLGIKIGTLAVNQEKYTSLLWHDSSEITYYFNSYSISETWATNPSYMVDGSTSTYASTTLDGDVELCNGNNCSGLNLGEIIKVELRTYGYYTSTQHDIRLRPIFDGTTDGLNYSFSTGLSPAWSRWFDITTDSFFTPPWNWTKIHNLDCDVEAKSGYGAFTLYCSKVEIRVTYIPVGNSVISNPYPADGSTGISISPVLNITVSDPDGDSMNITWLSNSSGSWQVFGTNNSVGNGTYHQTMANASVNGMWWYWKVNVTDGTASVESSVYKFYTGYESEIENTGSTNISGYLLIQVQYYNSSSECWVVDNDTVNESSPRTIKWNCPTGPAEQNILALDTIFNGLVKISDLTHGNGLYRVYAAFRDPDGNVLVTDDETPLEAWYEFNVNF